MLKKFLIGTLAIVALTVAVQASAAYDFGTTTLKVGSKGEAVKAVQTVVGATVDGSFGPMTKAKVMAWQANNGLTADGAFGAMSKAKANGVAVVVTGGALCPNGMLLSNNCAAVNTNSDSGVLTGGAGDATLTHYSTSEKSKIKEGDSKIKVLGFRIEASDSDVAVNNVKVVINNTAKTTSSYKITKYLDSVDIYQGSTKVGSADASDFTKSSTDSYSKSIAFSNAVVRDGDKDPFYVVFNAVDSIDSENSTASLTVSVESFRFTDASGVISTISPEETTSNVVTLDDSSDVLTLKSSSSNPDDATVTVSETNTTDEVLALSFKLKAGSDSADITLDKLPITLTIAGAGASVTSSEKVIDSVVVKIDGKSITADVIDSVINNAGSNTATYTADFTDENITIAKDETIEAKVYITFVEQGGTTANYANGATVVTASITGTAITAESTNDDTISPTAGTQTGADLTLSTSAVTLSNISWTKAEGTAAASIDLFFSIEAGDDDITLVKSDIVESKTNISGAGVLTKISGNATEAPTGTFAISSGDTANFRVRYTVTTTGGEVNLSTIKGQTVPDSKKLSPTAYYQ